MVNRLYVGIGAHQIHMKGITWHDADSFHKATTPASIARRPAISAQRRTIIQGARPKDGAMSSFVREAFSFLKLMFVGLGGAGR